MALLDSRVSINYSAFQRLVASIQAMKEHSHLRFSVQSLAQFNEDLAGVEGILLTCMALEATTFELMSSVVTILSHISESPIANSDKKIYSLPATLAEYILADIPVPVFVADTRIENTSDALYQEYVELRKKVYSVSITNHDFYYIGQQYIDVKSELERRDYFKVMK